MVESIHRIFGSFFALSHCHDMIEMIKTELLKGLTVIVDLSKTN